MHGRIGWPPMVCSTGRAPRVVMPELRAAMLTPCLAYARFRRRMTMLVDDVLGWGCVRHSTPWL